MREELRPYRTLGLLVFYVAIAFVLLLTERRTSRAPFGPVADATYQLTAGAQTLTASASASSAGFWDRYLDLVNVREENERMRAELNRLREEHARLVGVMQENARLRSLVGFREAHPALELVAARVVAQETSPYFRVSSIRLEVDDPRVVAGMPVVASAGVVGHVSERSGRNAQVLLACDPRSSIDILVQRNRARGVLVGLGHSNDYSSRIAYLLRRDEVVEGDFVVTSGMGGRFPPDLPVGRIADVSRREYGLFQEVIVEPAVDVSRLEEVYVVISEQGP